MAAHSPTTTFIVASDRDALILEKLSALEDGLQGLVPLLEKIVMHLETQAPPTTVPMATYADLYEEPAAGPPEGELVTQTMRPPPPAPRHWWTRLLEGAP